MSFLFRLAVIALPFVVASTAAAQGQATDSESAAIAQANAAGKDMAKRYEEKVREGISRAGLKDWDGAAQSFGEAVELRDGPADAHVLLGEVMRLQKKFQESERELRLGLDRAKARQNALWEARALMSLATTLETQGELQRAREVWIEAARFGDATKLIQPDAARARIQAIDLVFEREHVYIDVRQRIEDRNRLSAGAASDR